MIVTVVIRNNVTTCRMVWSVAVSWDNYQTSFRSFNYDYVVK